VPEGVRHDLFDGMGLEGLRVCAEDPLVTIGSHTMNHPDLRASEDGALRFELEESRRFLEAQLATPVDYFAYPFGLYDERVLIATRAAGYRAAFVEASRGVGDRRFEIPRIGIYDSSPSYLAGKLSGLHRRPVRGFLDRADGHAPT